MWFESFNILKRSQRGVFYQSHNNSCPIYEVNSGDCYLFPECQNSSTRRSLFSCSTFMQSNLLALSLVLCLPLMSLLLPRLRLQYPVSLLYRKAVDRTDWFVSFSSINHPPPEILMIMGEDVVIGFILHHRNSERVNFIAIWWKKKGEIVAVKPLIWLILSTLL